MPTARPARSNVQRVLHMGMCTVNRAQKWDRYASHAGIFLNFHIGLGFGFTFSAHGTVCKLNVCAIKVCAVKVCAVKSVHGLFQLM